MLPVLIGSFSVLKKLTGRRKYMVTINKSELLSKLGELLDLEVHELQQYSTTSTCSHAKEGMEDDYSRSAKKARLISAIENDIYFSMVCDCQKKQIKYKTSSKKEGK